MTHYNDDFLEDISIFLSLFFVYTYLSCLIDQTWFKLKINEVNDKIITNHILNH